MFRIGIRDREVGVHRGPLPALYGSYRQHATLAEAFDIDRPDGEACLVTVGPAGGWPSLVVAQRFEPCVAGFDPGVLLVPEAAVLFVGAGTRLLAYALDGPPLRMWEDRADVGFLCWAQHGEVVLMSAELELAAWDVRGRKLWTTFVEPPWGYTVAGDDVRLDVMGRVSTFLLAEGPGLPHG